MEKTCADCGEPKPRTGFSKNRRTKDGLHVYCKQCCSERARRHYARPAVRKARAAAYVKMYAIKREVILQRNRAYAKTERGRQISRRVSRQWEQSAEGKAWRSHWRARNADKIAAQRALHNAVRRGEIIRPKQCAQCKGGGRINGHHHKGYAPQHHLDVLWLCPTCHHAADPH